MNINGIKSDFQSPTATLKKQDSSYYCQNIYMYVIILWCDLQK